MKQEANPFGGARRPCARRFCWRLQSASGAPTPRRKTVIPLGQAVGIKLFADGVLVVDVSELEDGGARLCSAASERATCF